MYENSWIDSIDANVDLAGTSNFLKKPKALRFCEINSQHLLVPYQIIWNKIE